MHDMIDDVMQKREANFFGCENLQKNAGSTNASAEKSKNPRNRSKEENAHV